MTPARLFAGMGRLGRRLLWRMALVMALASAGVLVLSHSLVARSFDAFERATTAEALQRAETALKQDGQTLAELAQDYAWWDDFHAFMAGPSAEFLDSNFTESSFRNLRIKGVLALSPSGATVGARVAQGNTLVETVPPIWHDVLLPWATGRCAERKTQVVWADDQALMVGMADIRNTRANLPARGCLMLVRPMDEGYRKALESLTGVAFELLPPGGGASSPRPVGEGLWRAQAPLDPWPLLLSIAWDTHLHNERQGLLWLLGLVVGVVLLTALAALGAGVHTLVVARLLRFSALADAYRKHPNSTTTWPTQGGDEIANLGHSLNELVAAVHHQAEHNATHDLVTGLANRQGLERHLTGLAFGAQANTDSPDCLMLIDLDNFKVVNDGFGHDVGDALLCHAARQLEKATSSHDVVARMGGDEFAVLLRAMPRDHAQTRAQQVLASLRVPLTHGELEVATTGSLGLAFCDGADTPGALLRNADLAMYQAKQNGRDTCAFFNVNLKVDAQRRNRLEQALRQAVLNGRIQVVYQPVVDVARQQVVGMEALARWSLDGEAISPTEFIPIAEDTGLMGRLGMHVLSQSCDMVARLRRLGRHVPCSVNLSLRQFQEVDLADELPTVVFAAGLPASCIRLEITESVVESPNQQLVQTMQTLCDLGFEFALDDFGTGHSSLYRLQKLPFHTLKIDRSFVLLLDKGDDVMVRTVTDLARQLEMEVVAEGVDNRAQLQALRDLGVVRIQGFLVARPMSEAALLHWLATCSFGCPEVPPPVVPA